MQIVERKTETIAESGIFWRIKEVGNPNEWLILFSILSQQIGFREFTLVAAID